MLCALNTQFGFYFIFFFLPSKRARTRNPRETERAVNVCHWARRNSTQLSEGGSSQMFPPKERGHADSAQRHRRNQKRKTGPPANGCNSRLTRDPADTGFAGCLQPRRRRTRRSAFMTPQFDFSAVKYRTKLWRGGVVVVGGEF